VGHQVIFLRKLVPGGSEHSFGIHVAQMAGMPASIVKRANQVLKQLEAHSQGQSVSKPIPEKPEEEGVQLSFFQLDDPVLCQIRDRILNLDINSLTPLQALNMLNDIKRIVKGE
jgi:DNA mismatch repair protein MutS